VYVGLTLFFSIRSDLFIKKKKSVGARSEKLQRDFLWGSIGDEFKYHLVSWSKVCNPILEGSVQPSSVR